MRASTFVAELIQADAKELIVPVVGGSRGITILPLLSQVAGTEKLTQEQKEMVTDRIQCGGDEVVKAKAGAGSATLSMAFAGARFALNVIKAISGEKGIIEYAYVNVDGLADKSCKNEIKEITGEELSYFSVPVELGPGGVSQGPPHWRYFQL